MEATNTSLKKINKNGKIMTLTRRFLGNTKGKTTIEKKELKEYIKGNIQFMYRGQLRIVRQKYFYI